MVKIGHRGQFAMKGTYSWQNESGNYLVYKNHTVHHPEQFSIAVEHVSLIDYVPIKHGDIPRPC